MAWLTAAQAFADPAATIQVTGAWARATPGQSTIAAAYVTVMSPTGDRLTGASTPVAASAGIHEQTIADGVMSMRQIDGIDLPAGQAVTLKPSGLHIMLQGLKQKLVAGESFPLTLTFAKAGTVETKVSVQPVGAKGPAMGAMPGMAQ
jgi:copper(I)-binding protein